MKVYFFIIFFLFHRTLCYKYLDKIRSPVSAEKQASAALDVIYRLVPEFADNVHVQIDFLMPKNSFNMSSDGESIKIIASSGVAATKAFYFFCQQQNNEVAWEGMNLNVKMIGQFSVSRVADSDFIFYQNVCTWSYSFPWWTENDWIRHIDWIALQGINLVLAPFQENIWIDIYRELNLTNVDISSHFTGPAFFAWNRMGNLHGWNGPKNIDGIDAVTTFILDNAKLQRKVVRLLQNLGVSIAVPAFAGHVPAGLQQKFPQASFTNITWLNFEQQYSGSLFLDPTDPLFAYIGTKFLQKVTDQYGTNHLYFADPFNEMKPKSNDVGYIKNVSQAIFKVLQNYDSSAVWLLQGWMFANDPNFWQQPQIEAFLTAVPTGRMLVLDLYAEKKPQFNLTNSFYGQPFIWCMLHNFGGNQGMHGNSIQIDRSISSIRENQSFSIVGFGITPEGINQNHVMYEYVLNLAWEHRQSASNWFSKISDYRYGSIENLRAAWDILFCTVYNYTGTKHIGGSSPALITSSPSLKYTPWSWFTISSIEKVLDLFLKDINQLSNNELYLYDLVDVTRQYLQNLLEFQYLEIIDGYELGSVEKVKYHAKLFLGILLDADKILASNKNFLVGKWFEAADVFKNQDDWFRKKIPFGACNQITIWGPNGEIKDYATKQWAGLMKDYIYERWKLFFDLLQEAMENEQTFDEEAAKNKVFNEVEKPFCSVEGFQQKYSSQPVGDSIQIAKDILNKYTKMPRNIETQKKLYNFSQK